MCMFLILPNIALLSDNNYARMFQNKNSKNKLIFYNFIN